jgi:hypothetical protein
MGGVQMIKVSSKFDKKEWQCYEQVRCDMIVFITGAVPDSCPGHPCPTIPHRYAGLPMPLIKITSKPHTLAIPLGKLEVIWALRNLDNTRGRAVCVAPASLDLDRSWCGAALAGYRMRLVAPRRLLLPAVALLCQGTDHARTQVRRLQRGIRRNPHLP